MADKCNQCKCEVIESKRMPSYEVKEQGIKLLLIDSVFEEKCKKCGEVSHRIPNPKGLMAAAAIYRATMDWKLNGEEIKFVRKALELSAKELAECLQVAPETVSRWENDKVPISPTCEKLLRLSVCTILSARAPLISFDHRKIIEMQIRAIRQSKELVLGLRAAKTKIKDKVEDTYIEKAA